MLKTIVYSGHTIIIRVDLSTGSIIINDTNVLTNRLSVTIDGVLFMNAGEFTEDDLLAKIPDVQAQAEKRIDIMGTPSDSPLVEELIGLGFEFMPS